jgi:membrane-bound lytic murein transglycosylase D
MAQEIDDLRFLISKRTLEIYASRFNGVQGNSDEIPLVMNDFVQAEIKRFQTAERDFFLQSYSRSGRYRPHILEKLEEAGLPPELSWLPLIESGFKVKALSRSRALGLWQFIPSTGYKFGLKRNQWIDERMDVAKSTAAAIAYLRELHEIFGDWTTVLAAYNCGEGTVLRRIRRQKINYLDDFWDLYERLPRETARYVPRYLAVLHIIKNPERYGFALDGTAPPLSFEEVRVPKQVRLRDVAGQIGVPESVLVELNPELRYKASPKDYDLRVPPDKTQAFVTNLAKIPKYVPPKKQYAYHRVRRGETLSQIARKYRTSVRSISKANRIVRKDYIRVGQKLKIPVK